MKEVSAGGVVFRKNLGRIEFLVIEDRFRKISFVKGRVEPGETLPETALREIREETGLTGCIESILGVVNYQYFDSSRGQINKEVTYYLVEATGGILKPQPEEIRGVQWVSLAKAEDLHRHNGYQNNRQILSQALDILKQKLPPK